ncbi:MAG: hypothetical protein AAF335_04430, partial [Bacteroidota bacterium]
MGFLNTDMGMLAADFLLYPLTYIKFSFGDGFNKEKINLGELIALMIFKDIPALYKQKDPSFKAQGVLLGWLVFSFVFLIPDILEWFPRIYRQNVAGKIGVLEWVEKKFFKVETKRRKRGRKKSFLVEAGIVISLFGFISAFLVLVLLPTGEPFFKLLQKLIVPLFDIQNETLKNFVYPGGDYSQGMLYQIALQIGSVKQDEKPSSIVLISTAILAFIITSLVCIIATYLFLFIIEVVLNAIFQVIFAHPFAWVMNFFIGLGNFIVGPSYTHAAYLPIRRRRRIRRFRRRRRPRRIRRFRRKRRPRRIRRFRRKRRPRRIKKKRRRKLSKIKKRRKKKSIGRKGKKFIRKKDKKLTGKEVETD